MTKIPLIIDCDPGVDDALALILANTKDCFDIKAVTSVAGNVPIEYTTANLQILAGLLKLNCKIAKGENKPLVKKQITATGTHGHDGFGGYAYLLDDLNKYPLENISAVNLIADVLRESKEKVSIVAIGPLTNIAILIKAYPELLAKIEVISIMGGGLRYGNITSAAEFNFYVDPEAAAIVFNSGVKIILSALDVTLQAYITKEDIKLFEENKNRVADISCKILAAYASNDTALHDPVSVLAISNPEMFEYEDLFMQIETNEGSTRAMSYADNRNKKPDSNVRFITKLNRHQFIKEIDQCLKYYNM